MQSNECERFKIHGHLIGMIDNSSRARGPVALRERMRKAGPDTSFTVRTFVHLLNDAQQAHAEVLANFAKAERRHRASS